MIYIIEAKQKYFIIMSSFFFFRKPKVEKYNMTSIELDQQSEI